MPYGERVVTVPAVSERADASLYALKLGTGLRNLPRRRPGGSRHRRAAIKFYDLLAAAGCRIADRRDSPGFLRDHTRGRLPIAASGGIRTVGRRGMVPLSEMAVRDLWALPGRALGHHDEVGRHAKDPLDAVGI
jgi:hypothetical protein